jgi:hypothetical protein
MCKHNHKPNGKYKIQYRTTQTPDKCEGRIMVPRTNKHPLLTGHTRH